MAITKHPHTAAWKSKRDKEEYRIFLGELKMREKKMGVKRKVLVEGGGA